MAMFSQSIGITGDSTINQCETKTYTISIQNNSGNPLTGIVVTALLENFTGFSYVSGTASIDVNGGGAFCTADPSISGGYTGTCAPAPSAPYLTWAIDSLCGGPFTLNDNETLNVSFNLETDCTAVSGSLNTYIDYQISGTPFCDKTGAHSIQVLPGGVTIKKTPNVFPQYLGQNVTWTLTVENTGFGPILNVAVTDVLGSGLTYVSSSPAGVNTGQTTTWSSAEIAGLASMDPGTKITIDIIATVTSCQGLENSADVRWGCDTITDCYNTADTVPPSTAEAAVERIPRSPLLDYTPPDVNFTYCDDQENAAFTITNIGDGTAHNIWIVVDFGGLTVSNVSAGATYNAAQHRFELTDPMLPAGTYDLSYTLNYSSWCGGGFPTGSLLWQDVYLDECDQEFYPPVKLSQINAPVGSTSLSLTKGGAGEAVQIGSQVIYNITSSYSGPITCDNPSNNVGTITVVDTVPDGFTVVDAGGGTWVPGGGGTGGTITWTYTPPASLNTNITLQVPDRTQCETYCYTTFTNSVSASGIDCCGCPMTASASETTAIECEEFVDSNKTANPVTQERCDNIEYTNTYDFGTAGILLNTLNFTELAEFQQQYVPGSLSVIYDGSDITGCVAVTDTTPGGTLYLDFSGCAADLVNNKNLTIVYQLTITEATAAACSGSSFYSWSALDMGNTGSECLQDGIIRETTSVSTQPPAMSVNVTGLDAIVDQCQTHTITLTLTQTSTIATPKDVRLVLSGLNYYVVSPAAAVCSGAVAPTSCTPTIVGDDYVWYFGDGFSGSGQSAVIELDVRKRCGGGGDLVATAYYDDRCNDDGVYDDTCSTTATETPAVLRHGDLLIEKNPEVYYAATNTLEWKIYVTNRGTGTAYFVWVDDILGSGIDYQSAVVDDMTGVTVTDDMDHTGSAINGCTISISDMTPGERRAITLTAQLINCTNLTNDVTASWGCNTIDCQSPVSDSATAEIPRPLLINTNVVTTPADACSDPSGSITLRNAGQTTCYNLQIIETLPAGLTYVPGSTRWRLNGGAWNGPNAAYDPNPTTSPLQWTSTEIAGLAQSDPGDTIEIEFDFNAQCPFTGGDVTVATSYENPCGQVFNTANSVFTVAFREPEITITKTRADEPIDCGESVEWTIEITNTSGYTLPIVWVEDTLDAAFTYTSSVGDPPFTSDDGTYDGVNKVSWELVNVNHNDTVTLTLRATADTSPCSPDLDNTVLAWWGCGAADGSSATKPGTDPPDNSLCLTTVSTSTVRTETRRPELGYLDIAMDPVNIDACNDSTQMTIVMENTGPVDANTVDLVITLPAGITYNAGSAEVGLGTDQASATAAIGAVGDPAISGSTITFYDTGDKGSNIAAVIQAAGGNDTLVLRFTVQSACYVTANVGFNLRFYDCCDDTQYSATSQQQLSALFPNLSVTKTANLSQVNCGSNVEFTVRVTNSGTGNAEVIRVVDTLGNWLDYAGNFTEDQPGTITPAIIGGNPQVIGWEFTNLAAGATAEFTFEATLNPDSLPNQADCTAALRQNNVSAQWACGTTGDAVDDNPNTTSYDCTNSGTATAGPVTVTMPNLVVTGITPAISCSADGSFTGSISVTVQNQGSGSSTADFTVQVTDGKGWTGTGTYSGTITAGSSVSVSINTATWTPACHACAAPYSLNATVDPDNDVCECNEGDNDFGPQTYTAPIPDLVVNSITPTCTGDGLSRVTVNIGNTGCVNISTPFTLHLQDDQGTSRDIVVNSLNAGATTNINFTNWPTACSPASINFTATVDYNNNICECSGSNSANQAYNNTSPNLAVSTITPSASCSADGTISGTIQVQVANNGNGAVNSDFRITVNDGQGWSAQPWYVATLGGTLPIAAGTNATVNIPWTRTFTSTPYVCSFPTITVTVDSSSVICECSNASNANTTSYTLPLSNLRVISVTPTCTGDSSYSVAVVVDNNGCGNAAAVTVQLSDNDGQTQSQVIALNAGAQQTVTFSPWPADGNPATLTFTATIDPASAVCELSGADNSANTTYDRANLNLVSITPSCTTDDTFQVSMVIQNNGSSAVNTDFTVRLADNDGNTLDQNFTAVGGTLPLNNGTQQTVTFGNWPFDCNPTTVNFTGTLDPTNQVCESSSGDNTNTGTITLYDLQAVSVTASASCSADGTISGTMSVAVRNSGGNAINSDFHISVSDGQGWTSELLYNADLGGTLPLGAGASDTVSFNWTRDFTTPPYVCNFASMGATVDSQGDICECTNANNTASGSYTLPSPNLRVISITPTCTDDSSYSIAVVVDNNGCAAANGVVVRLSDNDGHSQDQTVNLNAGAQQTVTFAPWPADGNPATLTFTASVDPASAVCELSGADNSANTTYDRANLELVSITPSCTSDDTFQVSVVIENNGSSAVNTDFVVRLTDNDGNTLDQNFTAVGGTLPLNNGTQQTVVFNNWPMDGNPTTINFTGELDPTDQVCESISGDNTNTGTITVYGLRAVSVTASEVCTADGSITGTITVTITNNGGNTINGDFQVQVDDGQGWTSELFYNADLGGTLPLAPGASEIVTFNWTRGFTTAPYTCNFPAITVTVDSGNAICESTSADNQASTNHTLNLVDLTIDAVASSITCISDGSLTGTNVTVSNTGCANASGVTVRLSSDCGLTFTDQTVDVDAGETINVFFPFTSGITSCSCNFTAAIDPDDTICEMDGTNNTGTSTQPMVIPNVEIQGQNISINCVTDGTIRVTGTVTLLNNGCGPNLTENLPMRFTLYDSAGCSGNRLAQWTQVFTGVDIASSGGTQLFTIQPFDIVTDFCSAAASSGCRFSVFIEADYTDSLCEWDGTDNTSCEDINAECLDLEATAVTAAANITSNGVSDGTITVTVRNNGADPLTEDFSIRVDDGNGWTSELRYHADLGGPLPLAPGASVDVTFTWNRDFTAQPFTCDFNITARLDSQDEYCQCRGENDTVTTTYHLPLANLRPTAITPTCGSDGTYRIDVTVENDGCTGATAGRFTVRLEDSLGHSASFEVESLGSGSSTTVTFTDWPASCDPDTITFTVRVDYNNTVYEITETDNSLGYSYTNTSPDLLITGVTPSATCSSPGNIDGTMTVTLTNNGNGPVTEDFKIIIDDGQGWTAEKYYHADLNGTLPVAVGDTTTVTVDWNRDFTGETPTCDFNAIRVSIDVQTSVCECASGNNETVADYVLPFPDLFIQSLDPVCSADGERYVEMTVGNRGCGPQTEDFNLNITDSTGEALKVSFRSLGGRLPLGVGETQRITISEWSFDCGSSSVEYRVSLDPENKVCDLTPSDNSFKWTHTPEEPDLTIGDIDWNCNDNGSITFTVTISNTGFGGAFNAPFAVYDENGNAIFNGMVNLAQGTSTQFTFTTGVYPKDQDHSFRFVVDEGHVICECDGTNNEKSTVVNCPSDGGGGEEEGEPVLKLVKFCPPGQSAGGLFRFELQLENTGDADAENVRIEDTLPEGFQYAPGSSALDGKSISDPLTGPPLVWTIGTLTKGSRVTLVFSAVASADIDPDRYMNEGRAVGTGPGSTGPVVSEPARCYTVVTRETGAGCCLKVEQWPMDGGQRPEGPLSFIEPYFRTESAMFTSYAIFKLWRDTQLETGSLPLFMRERLHNYALSTIEEFYLHSRLGLTLPDGTLWLSLAGAYPESEQDSRDLQDLKDKKRAWVRKQVDETMTVSQVGFELLALNEAVKIETRQDVQQKLKLIIDKKMEFLNPFMTKPEELPHGWEIEKEDIKRLNAGATLYDKAVLYLSMVELGRSGYAEAASFASNLRGTLTHLDGRVFDPNNLREELMFILSLLETGQTEQAKEKIGAFEDIYTGGGTAKTREEKPNGMMKGLHDYALAAAVDKKAGGSLYPEIMKEMKEKYYLEDTGIYADKQPDFTFKMTLDSLAGLLLSFETADSETREVFAPVLYRTFDEVGIFLKKRNLVIGKPLYSLLKNYPFAEPFLPVLSFTKANKDTAPVFSESAIVHSTRVKPLGEVLIPGSFSKILSPTYETRTSRAASLSFGLQYFGKLLSGHPERVIREEGRSLNESGKEYMDSLLLSGAGILLKGKTLIPYENLAVKGPKQGEHNLEPLNSTDLFSTETLADYMAAEKLYLEGGGKHMPVVFDLLAFQDRIVEKFKGMEYIPASFRIFIDEAADEITLIPSVERASKMTIAKLYHILPKDGNHKFLEKALKKAAGPLEVYDLIFLSANPELVPYFKNEVKEIVEFKDSKVSYNAADIIGRRLLGDTAPIENSLKNLLENWDKDTVLPKSDLVEDIEKGLIYHHEPRQLLLYLLAVYDSGSFQFERTLNFFTYLLENEWGLEWNSFIKLPSAEYGVFREEPRERFEPGDLVNFRVRVDNTCPDGFGSAWDLGSLYLKANFTPAMIYTGTQPVEGLDVVGDFQWRYNGFGEGSVLEYIYQGFVPYDFQGRFTDGWIYAGGRRGYEDFGPGTGMGNECEDLRHIRGLNFIPFSELNGLVFEDRNVNGVKDVGEPGVPNIMIKDTRGRVLRSDAEGRFTVLAGDLHEGVQVELKSVPGNYVLNGPPTRLVNRNYVGDIYFALIPCKTVTGFVYIDSNGNGAYDESEPRPAGVQVIAKDKEVVTGKDGAFIFRNLPYLWQQWIEVKKEQSFFKGNKDSLKFSL